MLTLTRTYETKTGRTGICYTVAGRRAASFIPADATPIAAAKRIAADLGVGFAVQVEAGDADVTPALDVLERDVLERGSRVWLSRLGALLASVDADTVTTCPARRHVLPLLPQGTDLVALAAAARDRAHEARRRLGLSVHRQARGDLRAAATADRWAFLAV